MHQTMTFLNNKSGCILSVICIICMVMMLFLVNLTDRMYIPYEKIKDNLFKLHPDVLTESSLKYQSLVNEIYAERVLHLRETCRVSSDEFLGDSKDNDVKHNIHVEQNHNLVYCQIQKVGSTFLRKLLSKVFMSSNIQKSKRGFIRLTQHKDIGFAELHSVIQKSDKFMFVREPFSRVLSGYVDKLFCTNTLYWKITGKYIVSQIRDDASSASLRCGHDVTFPEFVKYIIQSENLSKHKDRHFTPMYEHCRPCQIPYDFIGKLESFKEDVLFLINVWNNAYGTNITFNDFDTETSESRVLGQASRIFGMRKQLERCMSFYNASVRSWRDLQIRGVLPIQEPYPFSPEFTRDHMTRMDFFEAAKQAIASVSDIRAVKAQRNEAFIEAFSLIPMEDLYQLQNILKPDCDLFNYDCKPPKIFARNKNNDKRLKYFDLL
ncbi:carbohydrate 4-sulfotransferase 8 [Mytilus galloprovincialis]|uniref:Carbohydrate sulfotransferase n=2 Tax=Mytilus galloprovincialis TaxID=29158 RepID=A0A8B6DL41_MYTGA|nr:carbohydrate 4-sulfotransferase 8 [Mytilus galloprovincialis]